MTAFARITELHDRLALDLTPCAGQLYRWLLRAVPAGKPQEVELEAFQARTGYSLKWIKAALQQLVDTSLVEIVKRYSGRVFKLIAFHPDPAPDAPIDPPAADGKKTSQTENKTSDFDHKTSQKYPSNPDSFVPYNREDQSKQTPIPPTHPVCQNEQEKEKNHDGPSKPNSPTPITPDPIQQELLHEAEQTGVKLNPHLIQVIITAGVNVVQDAIAALKERLQKGQVKNPAGFLRQAIQFKWSPNAQSPSQTFGFNPPPSPLLRQTVPDGFNPWYELARQVGLIEHSTCQEERYTGFTDGTFCVLTFEGWQPWDSFSQLFPLAELQELAALKANSANHLTGNEFTGYAASPGGW